MRERTEALNQTMDELKHSNKALNRAREEAETTRQRLADAIESIANDVLCIPEFNGGHDRGCKRQSIQSHEGGPTIVEIAMKQCGLNE